MDLTNLTVSQAATEIEGLIGGNETSPQPEADQPTDVDAETDAPQGDEDQEITDENAEPSDDEEAEEENDDPELEIKHNGEIKKLPKSEVIALAQKGFDYEHKTKLVAEEKKVAEETKAKYTTMQSEAEHARNSALEQNELMQAFLNSQVPTETQLLAVLQQDGTDAYLRAKARADQTQKAIDVLKQQQSSHKEEFKKQFEEQRKETEAKEREASRNAVPELGTPEVSGKLVSYLQDLGYTSDQISNEVDHRLFVIAHKARKYDELMKAGEARKSTVTVPKVTKQSSTRPDVKTSKMDGQQKAMQTLRNTGKTQDAAQAILARFN